MIVLSTPRLTLRHLELDDATFILRLLNEEGFLRYIGDKGVRILSDARSYIAKGPRESYGRHGYGLYLCELLNGLPIGICGLVRRDALPAADIGFAFLAAHCSRGYASEAAMRVVEHARTTLGMQRVLAITAQDNHASMAVLRKIGLKFERKITLVAEAAELNLFATAPPPAEVL